MSRPVVVVPGRDGDRISANNSIRYGRLAQTVDTRTRMAKVAKCSKLGMLYWRPLGQASWGPDTDLCVVRAGDAEVSYTRSEELEYI